MINTMKSFRYVKENYSSEVVEPCWAREFLKTSADPYDSNVAFEIGLAHLWRLCDVVLGENPFFT